MTRKKGSGGSRKGGCFERDFCSFLSLWWSEGQRDDLFWRTGGSGGRARVRGRQGKQTQGQHGDVAATDPIAAPFIDLITIELKRGYNKFTLADLLDRPDRAAVQMWETWILKAQESCQQAGSFSWMIATQRDRREGLVVLPHDLAVALFDLSTGSSPILVPSAQFHLQIEGKTFHLWGMHTTAFFFWVKPSSIRKLSKEV